MGALILQFVGRIHFLFTRRRWGIPVGGHCNPVIRWGLGEALVGSWHQQMCEWINAAIGLLQFKMVGKECQKEVTEKAQTHLDVLTLIPGSVNEISNTLWWFLTCWKIRPFLSRQSDFLPPANMPSCSLAFLWEIHSAKPLHLLRYSHNTRHFSGTRITLAWLSEWLSPKLSFCWGWPRIQSGRLELSGNNSCNLPAYWPSPPQQEYLKCAHYRTHGSRRYEKQWC